MNGELEIMKLRIVAFIFILFLVLVGCSSKPKWEQYKKGTNIILEIEKTNDETRDGVNQLRVNYILKQRLLEYGVNNFLTKIIDENRINLQLPSKVQPKDKLLEIILKPYLLEFKIVNDAYSLENIDIDNIPSDIDILYPMKNSSNSDKTPLIVDKETLMTGDYITATKVRFDKHSGHPHISFQFNEKGAKILEQITASNIRKRLAIILDDEIVSAPKIYSKIVGGQAMLTGNFSDEEAAWIAFCLGQGSYPANVSLLKKEKIKKDLWIGNDTATED
jgi:preprotein translocase subunit SecD